MRDIALDVHIDFCEVAIAEGGEVRSAGRIAAKPEELELFAQSLGREDRVALEVTGNAWAIKRIIEPRVAEVIVVSPSDRGRTKPQVPRCSSPSTRARSNTRKQAGMSPANPLTFTRRPTQLRSVRVSRHSLCGTQRATSSKGKGPRPLSSYEP